MSEIILSKVSKAFGDTFAVRELDLVAEKGAFVTLLGPSGCGKTTTLRIIAGLEAPTVGDVVLAGQPVFSFSKGISVPPEKRGLGLIFQSYALWPNMKVDRNITLALKEAKLPADEIEARLAEALQKTQLDGYRHRYPSELSGGQQQRVAVGRLIAARSSILLMDEPLSNLDAVLRTDMRTELKLLHRDLNATTVYVTHDQVEALTISDIIVIMKDGVVQQQGSPSEVYHSPANLFVAEFIGDPRINVFSGPVRRTGGQSAVEFCGLALESRNPLPEGLKTVDFAIRPEAVAISDRPVDGAIEAAVVAVQPTGSQTIIHARNGDHRFTILEPGFTANWAGGSAWLTLPEENLAFFDPASGENLQSMTVA
ncbi:MAG: ABC transporter ATP-binding protein [Rhodospirillales bacterium]|nr:ABC transporter ATP-binding protein [Rhodospirillales bacterium]